MLLLYRGPVHITEKNSRAPGGIQTRDLSVTRRVLRRCASATAPKNYISFILKTQKAEDRNDRNSTKSEANACAQQQQNKEQAMTSENYEDL